MKRFYQNYIISTLYVQVKDTVAKKCNQKEKDKFISYLKDRDVVISLLLKMSGLLARAENALQGLPEKCESRQRVCNMSVIISINSLLNLILLCSYKFQALF